MPGKGDGRRLVLNGQSETLRTRDRRAKRASASSGLRAALGGLLLIVMGFATGSAHAETRELKFYNTHTKERATIVFKRNGKYDRAGLAKVNHMLRDWRRDQPTKMDTELVDLIWEVYRKSGSKDYIHIVSGYRSPETNSMLRKRSRGVAKNSQHTRGRAMDFYLPDVPLAKLRAIGLRMEVGGVGFYPTSGSPFVHMDTGSVRHWPRMNRKQLVTVFPNGKTLHVPSDGKPLPGYAQALAAHKIRGRGVNSEIASVDDNVPIPPSRATRSVGEPVIASVSDGSEDDDLEANGDSSAEIAAFEPPLPRPSPVPTYSQPAPVIVAAAQPVPPHFQPRSQEQFAFASIGGAAMAPSQAPPLEFASASNWSAPSVPADLARAMAERDVSRATATSLPIRPTAVVATIDVSRPLRAEAMTSAVMQGSGSGMRDVTPVFAYAAAMEPSAPAPRPTYQAETAQAETADFGAVPVPVANPMWASAAPTAVVIAAPVERPATRRLPRQDLTLTALDTLGLRLWMASQSTRQKQYAVLTMPDFSRTPSLIDKPVVAYSAGFGSDAYQGMRTDRFSGPVARMPSIVDLQSRQRLAHR
jgi:uncharacterized protein YcbK (DUF882 family)